MSAHVSTFDSDKKTLQELLSGIHSGSIQLPDFQRSWVWDDDHIKSLIASVSLSFPIGAVLFLETDQEQRRFLPRTIEGVANMQRKPDLLILDGQQRLTSLYQTLYMGQAVKTKNARNRATELWYYVDMNKALNPTIDRENVIVSLPEDRVLRTNFNRDIELDCSTVEKECAAEMFPLRVLFDIPKRNEWVQQFLKSGSPEQMMERMNLWNAFQAEIVTRIEQYSVPIIRLRKETPPEAVALVFEKVNTGGVSLTVFELVTAMFASENFRLRKDWRRRYEKMTEQPKTKPLLEGIEESDFLTGVALLSSFRKYRNAQAGQADEFVKCKRKDILSLKLSDYQAVADDLTQGFIQAAKFLVQRKIFQRRDLPYTTQLVPLAAILASLGEKAEYDVAREKLARWFWCGVFGELYSSSVETRFAKDLPEVVAWVRDGGPEPSTIAEASFAAERLYRLRTRNSAAYKGVSALLMREGGLDFLSGESVELNTFFEEKLDIHHIFPQKWCKDRNIERRTYNSIINKTPITGKTNRIIGGKAPSDYLGKLEGQAGMPEERLDEILETHLIPPEYLREDDFEGFFKARADHLLSLIERAMGKPITRDQSDPFDIDVEDEEEDYEEAFETA